jgi:hypothetical protein
MEKVKILFQGTERSQTGETDLEVFASVHNEIFIIIKDDGYSPRFICLDKPTAVRLVRELKKQIGFLMEGEVYNG